MKCPCVTAGSNPKPLVTIKRVKHDIIALMNAGRTEITDARLINAARVCGASSFF